MNGMNHKRQSMDRSLAVMLDSVVGFRLKEKHASEMAELSQDLEASAVTKLTTASRRALEENTMLLRQVTPVQ